MLNKMAVEAVTLETVQTGCGDWPKDVREELLADLGLSLSGKTWSCVAYSQVDELKRGRGGSVDKAQCADRCTAQHDSWIVAEGQWCCQFTPESRGSSTCKWTNGRALFDSAQCVMRGARGSQTCEMPDAFTPCYFVPEFQPLSVLDECELGGKPLFEAVHVHSAAAC
jgi:hypothetical protein